MLLYNPIMCCFTAIDRHRRNAKKAYRSTPKIFKISVWAHIVHPPMVTFWTRPLQLIPPGAQIALSSAARPLLSWGLHIGCSFYLSLYPEIHISNYLPKSKGPSLATFPKAAHRPSTSLLFCFFWTWVVTILSIFILIFILILFL